jgi:hypothetical protein
MAPLQQRSKDHSVPARQLIGELLSAIPSLSMHAVVNCRISEGPGPSHRPAVRLGVLTVRPCYAADQAPPMGCKHLCRPVPWCYVNTTTCPNSSPCLDAGGPWGPCAAAGEGPHRSAVQCGEGPRRSSVAVLSNELHCKLYMICSSQLHTRLTHDTCCSESTRCSQVELIEPCAH